MILNTLEVYYWLQANDYLEICGVRGRPAQVVVRKCGVKWSVNAKGNSIFIAIIFLSK